MTYKSQVIICLVASASADMLVYLYMNIHAYMYRIFAKIFIYMNILMAYLVNI